MGARFVSCVQIPHRSVGRLVLEFWSFVFSTSHARYTTGEDTSLRTLIDAFLDAESKLQQVANPSGNVTTGGLGEPKFNIDLSAFTHPWGR